MRWLVSSSTERPDARERPTSPLFPCGASRRHFGEVLSVNPSLSLRSHLELFCDLLGGALGRALDGGSAAHFAFHLRRAADDEPDGIATGHGHGERHRLARALGALRVELPRTEAAESSIGPHIHLDHRRQLGGARAEADSDALGDTARVDRHEVPNDCYVIEQRWWLAVSPNGRQTHLLE